MKIKIVETGAAYKRAVLESLGSDTLVLTRDYEALAHQLERWEGSPASLLSLLQGRQTADLAEA